MIARATAREVADQAAEWAMKIDAGGVDPDKDDDLLSWLAADPRCRGALLRAEAALSFVDRGRALAGVIPRPTARPVMRRMGWMLTAASLAAGIACVAVYFPWAQRYNTGLGEIREVPLSDGSLIAINTQSSVAVQMGPALREVNLTRGEAWFRVAHDTGRPFVVSAGRVRVRAVGTAFSVSRHDDGADVIVTEGAVETWTTGAEDHRLKISAGSKAFVARYEPSKVVAAATVDVTRSLAWRDGQIALEGQTLGEAAEQFNRYNTHKIVIADSELAKATLVGQFRLSEPMTFASAVATTLGATVADDGSEIRLSRAPR